VLLLMDHSRWPRSQIDHFADMRQMVPRIVSRSLTGSYGFVNDGRKVPPIGIPQQHLEVTGTPVLDAGIRKLPHHILKTGVVSNHEFFIHAASPLLRLAWMWPVRRGRFRRGEGVEFIDEGVDLVIGGGDLSLEGGLLVRRLAAANDL